MSAGGRRVDEQTPVYVISVAAELAGMHAQTLRQYDRIGLVTPSRAGGGGRRYSARDIARLEQVKRLSQEGVSLVGIRRIFELEDQVAALQARLRQLTVEARGGGPRVFAASQDGQIVALRPGVRPTRREPGTALVRWRQL